MILEKLKDSMSRQKDKSPVLAAGFLSSVVEQKLLLVVPLILLFANLTRQFEILKSSFISFK